MAQVRKLEGGGQNTNQFYEAFDDNVWRGVQEIQDVIKQLRNLNLSEDASTEPIDDVINALEKGLSVRLLPQNRFQFLDANGNDVTLDKYTKDDEKNGLGKAGHYKYITRYANPNEWGFFKDIGATFNSALDQYRRGTYYLSKVRKAPAKEPEKIELRKGEGWFDYLDNGSWNANSPENTEVKNVIEEVLKYITGDEEFKKKFKTTKYASGELQKITDYYNSLSDDQKNSLITDIMSLAAQGDAAVAKYKPLLELFGFSPDTNYTARQQKREADAKVAEEKRKKEQDEAAQNAVPEGWNADLYAQRPAGVVIKKDNSGHYQVTGWDNKNRYLRGESWVPEELQNAFLLNGTIYKADDLALTNNNTLRAILSKWNAAKQKDNYADYYTALKDSGIEFLELPEYLTPYSYYDNNMFAPDIEGLLLGDGPFEITDITEQFVPTGNSAYKVYQYINPQSWIQQMGIPMPMYAITSQNGTQTFDTYDKFKAYMDENAMVRNQSGRSRKPISLKKFDTQGKYGIVAEGPISNGKRVALVTDRSGNYFKVYRKNKNDESLTIEPIQQRNTQAIKSNKIDLSKLSQEDFLRLKEGGILKFQNSGLVPESIPESEVISYSDNDKLNEFYDALTEDWSADDWWAITNAVGDLTGAVAGNFPGAGTIVSGITGVGSSISDFIRDQVYDRSENSGWRLAANLGLDLMGLVPGLGIGSKAKKMATSLKRIWPVFKRAIPILAEGYLGVQVADNLINKPVEDWGGDEWNTVVRLLTPLVVAGGRKYVTSSKAGEIAEKVQGGGGSKSKSVVIKKGGKEIELTFDDQQIMNIANGRTKKELRDAIRATNPEINTANITDKQLDNAAKKLGIVLPKDDATKISYTVTPFKTKDAAYYANHPSKRKEIIEGAQRSAFDPEDISFLEKWYPDLEIPSQKRGGILKFQNGGLPGKKFTITPNIMDFGRLGLTEYGIALDREKNLEAINEAAKMRQYVAAQQEQVAPNISPIQQQYQSAKEPYLTYKVDTPDRNSEIAANLAIRGKLSQLNKEEGAAVSQELARTNAINNQIDYKNATERAKMINQKGSDTAQTELLKGQVDSAARNKAFNEAGTFLQQMNQQWRDAYNVNVDELEGQYKDLASKAYQQAIANDKGYKTLWADYEKYKAEQIAKGETPDVFDVWISKDPNRQTAFAAVSQRNIDAYKKYQERLSQISRWKRASRGMSWGAYGGIDAEKWTEEMKNAASAATSAERTGGTLSQKRGGRLTVDEQIAVNAHKQSIKNLSKQLDTISKMLLQVMK